MATRWQNEPSVGPGGAQTSEANEPFCHDELQLFPLKLSSWDGNRLLPNVVTPSKGNLRFRTQESQALSDYVPRYLEMHQLQRKGARRILSSHAFPERWLI